MEGILPLAMANAHCRGTILIQWNEKKTCAAKTPGSVRHIVQLGDATS